ncbi:MAG: diguanylate cyclase [Mariprofundaceae bacterium]|nr:diguanylate cyclase [Mariprofundaceae bacterium]
MSATILWITKASSSPIKHQQHILHTIQSTTDMHCHICSDEELAISMIKKLKPTVILQSLQGTHSLDLLRTYKTHALLSAIPVIMIESNNSPKPIRNYAFFRGCNDYIELTVGKQELLARIRLQSATYLKNIQYLDIKNSLAKTNDKLQVCQTMLDKSTSLDVLTGIANRQTFAQHYEREWSRALRETEPLSVLIANIDHFKAYNDHYGYQQGDRCLKIISQTMQEVLQRPTDFCARYCGEEFIILLPTTTAKGGIYIAERLRKAVIDLNIPHKHSETKSCLTLSLGLATTSPMLKHKARDLIRAADSARFEAKKQGRNRLICKSI